jgi:hypothetical protein
LAADVGDALGPDALHPPTLCARLEAESDQKGTPMDLERRDVGPAPLGPSAFVPLEHLTSVAAQGIQIARRAQCAAGLGRSPNPSTSAASSVARSRSAMASAVTGLGGRVMSSLIELHETSTLTAVPAFDPQEMVTRFRERAEAVRTRGMPPIEGPERQRFREQAQRDFADFAMIGDAEAEIVDGVLTLRIDLRPKNAEGG